MNAHQKIVVQPSMFVYNKSKGGSMRVGGGHGSHDPPIGLSCDNRYSVYLPILRKFRATGDDFATRWPPQPRKVAVQYCEAEIAIEF